MPYSGCTALHRVNPNSKQSSLVPLTVFALYVEDGSVSELVFISQGSLLARFCSEFYTLRIWNSSWPIGQQNWN